MKILIIDDEPLVRLSLKRVAESKAYQVAEAEDGAVGLKVWKEFLPDLVFLDVLMPGLTGPQVLERIREWGQSDARVVLISAYTGKYDFKKARSLGADLFIPKPFDNIFQVMEEGVSLVQGGVGVSTKIDD
ncbi:MAG: response regulator [Bdellovibrio sp.]|nr:MAG: response regulator [Bdellovibrio sp.]